MSPESKNLAVLGGGYLAIWSILLWSLTQLAPDVSFELNAAMSTGLALGLILFALWMSQPAGRAITNDFLASGGQTVIVLTDRADLTQLLSELNQMRNRPQIFQFQTMGAAA